MKAAVYHRYGGPEVVSLVNLPRPKPDEHSILIRVVASSVSSGDWRARSLDLPAGMGLIGRLVFGLTGPRQPILGGDLSGIVEEVGSAVTDFKVGDEVIAYPGAKLGSHAEYRTMRADGLVIKKPASISFEQGAALLFGGTTALDFLRNKGGIKSGDHVLVVGASGAVGSAAVQIAKHFGAVVTGVTSTGNVELVRSLGADHVVDYRKQDFTSDGRTYDIILNTNGSVPFAKVEHSLRPGGRLLLVLASAAQMFGLERARGDGKRIVPGVAAPTRADLDLLANLVEAGDFTPVVDRIYPLESVREAHAYVDTGRKRGNVMLRLA